MLFVDYPCTNDDLNVVNRACNQYLTYQKGWRRNGNFLLKKYHFFFPKITTASSIIIKLESELAYTFQMY